MGMEIGVEENPQNQALNSSQALQSQQLPVVDEKLRFSKTQIVPNTNISLNVKNQVNETEGLPDTNPTNISQNQITNSQNFVNEAQVTETNNQEMNNQEMNNQEMNNPEMYNQEINNPEMNNQEMQNQEIQNQEIQNQEIQNQEINNPEMNNQEMNNPEMQNQEMQNQEMHRWIVAISVQSSDWRNSRLATLSAMPRIPNHCHLSLSTSLPCRCSSPSTTLRSLVKRVSSLPPAISTTDWRRNWRRTSPCV